MLTKEFIRFVDANTFQEAAPPEDRSRPLEWRRSFNTISFDVLDPEVEFAYSINEIDHFTSVDIGSEQDKEPTHVVTGAPKRRIRVCFDIHQKDLRDSVLQTKEMEKGSGLFQLCHLKDPIHVTLIEADPTESRGGPYADGSYDGLAFQADFKPGEDNLYIEVGVPSNLIEEIADELKTGRVNAMHVSIGIQSFSFEVDDALREWYHRRNLFIHGRATQAVLQSLRLLRRDPKSDPAPALEGSEEQHAETLDDNLPPSPVPDYNSVLKGIKTAMWVIAALLLLQLLK
jgi:hypothetical protein